MTECNPDNIKPDQTHKHNLACEHTPLKTEDDRVVYLDSGQVEEMCDDDHVHTAQICLTHEFTAVADPDEDCSQRDDCHLVVKDNGTAEIYHPSAKGRCEVVGKLDVLIP